MHFVENLWKKWMEERIPGKEVSEKSRNLRETTEEFDKECRSHRRKNRRKFGSIIQLINKACKKVYIIK